MPYGDLMTWMAHFAKYPQKGSVEPGEIGGALFMKNEKQLSSWFEKNRLSIRQIAKSFICERQASNLIARLEAAIDEYDFPAITKIAKEVQNRLGEINKPKSFDVFAINRAKEKLQIVINNNGLAARKELEDCYVLFVKYNI